MRQTDVLSNFWKAKAVYMLKQRTRKTGSEEMWTI
jgi:hypothetical protein